MSPNPNPIARVALGAMARLYEAVVRARNRRFDRVESAVCRAPVPVVSVGNLTVGGTGKTPIVAWLADRLLQAGHRPAVVSRGYGGRAGRGPLVVSRGDGPLVEAETCGDEPYLLARSHREVVVVVGSDRPAGAERASALGCDCVVLDDGFQHRRIGRDLDLVLLDAGNPFGGDRLLPAGRLREPVDGIARADVVLITRSEKGDRFPEIENIVRRYNPGVMLLGAGHRRVGFVDILGEPATAPERAVVFCAIGNPERFRADVLAEEIDLVEFRPAVDHHPYTATELRELAARASSSNATLVTTEKDIVRSLALLSGNDAPPVVALRIEADVHQPDELLGRVLAAVRARTPG